MWHVTTDRGDHMTAHVRDLRQRHAVQAEAGDASTAWRRSRALVPHLALGLRVHRARTSSTSHDKVVGIIGTGASAVQVIPNLGATAKELYVFQRTPSSIDVRDDWETDPGVGGEAASRAGRPSAGRRSSTEPPLTAEQQVDSAAAMTREEKIRRQENANIDAHDADPPPHRRDRRGPGDGRVAEALVHVHVQAAVLPQRLPADVQPAQRPPRRHARRGHHRDRRRRARCSTARRTSSTC